MAPSNSIPARTRTKILDWFMLADVQWSGVDTELAFLFRLYDLAALPSYDSRPAYTNAAEDIAQHRVRNEDWGGQDWVFTDPRFKLLYAPDTEFLDFLIATIRPQSRPETTQVEEMVAVFNSELIQAGWEIVPGRRFGGKPVYEYQRTSGIHSPSAVVVDVPNIVDGTVLRETLTRLQRDIDSDPAATIAHCKELLESQMKLVLRQLGRPSEDRDDILKLYGDASRALGIHADSVPGDSRGSNAVRGLLRNMASIVQNIAEARNALGTGHGRAESSAAERRHARLIFNATVSITEFVADTWTVTELFPPD